MLSSVCSLLYWTTESYLVWRKLDWKNDGITVAHKIVIRILGLLGKSHKMNYNLYMHVMVTQYFQT